MLQPRMKINTDRTILIGPVRLAFCRLAEPSLNKLSGRYQYSLCWLLPKGSGPLARSADDESSLAADVDSYMIDGSFEMLHADFDAYIKGVALAQLGGKTFSPRWKGLLRDGDSDQNDEAQNSLAGYWFQNASNDSKHPPAIIGPDGNLMPVDVMLREWLPGNWANIRLAPYVYETEGNKGVGYGIRAVQWAYHDTPFYTVLSPEEIAQEFMAF